jgi:tetratricopeptide (TPR) repeat protein
VFFYELVRQVADAGLISGMADAADLFYEMNKKREAIALFEKARDIDPNPKSLQVNKMFGYAHFNDFNLDKSIETYEKSAAPR